MEETGIVLRCENTGITDSGGSIDPLAYPADIGRIGEALVLYDRVVIISNNLREIPGMVVAFGEDVVRYLFEKGVLTLYFQQEQPLFIPERGVSLGWITTATDSHPRPDDVFLRNDSDFDHFFNHSLVHYPYLDEYEGVSADTLSAIKKRTHLAPKEMAHNIAAGFNQWFGKPSIRELLANKLRERGRKNCLIDKVLIEDGRQLVIKANLDPEESAYASQSLLTDLYIVSDIFLETMLSPLVGETAVLSEVEFDTVIKTQATTDAFRYILELEKFPRIADCFYLNPISGKTLIKLREDSNTTQLRRWLGTSKGEDADSIVSAYVKSLGKMIHNDSLAFSGFRAIGTTALGLLIPIAGLLATGSEWLYSKFYYRPDWNPRLFIDDTLSKTITQKRAATRGLVIPTDPMRLIRNGWRPISFNQSYNNGVDLILKRSPAETFKLGYKSEIETYRLFNNIWQEFTRASGTFQIIIECNICKQKNRFYSNSSSLTPICSVCKTRLLPFNI